MYTILIADDEYPARSLIRMLIAGLEDFQVVGEASNGVEGLEQFARIKPDIVLADIEMPVMNGLDMIEHMRSIRSDQMIIILSCYESFSYAQRAIRLGINDYLVKDMTTEESLLACLRRVTDRNTRQPEQSAASFHSIPEKAQDIPGLGDIQRKNIERHINTLSSCFFSYNEKRTVDELHAIFGIALVGLTQFRLLQNLNETVIGWIQIECIRHQINTEEIITDAKSPLTILKDMNSLSDACEQLCQWVRSLMQHIHNSTMLSPRMRNIMDYINEYYSQNLTLNSIAEAFSLHPVYLSRYFKQEMGVNLSNYINFIRIEKAKLLLSMGSYRINEIAYMVGFNNSQSFYSVFKKSVGCTPTLYIGDTYRKE